jgi:phosphoglycolate phosphatase
MGLPHDCWPEADRLWLELYAEERNELMPGAREALARLRDAGLAVGLVTSGERDRIEAELAGHGVAELFDVVVCGGDVANRKPHPEALEAALGSIDMPSVAAAYIGDSPEDVEMARAAGAYSVGVPGGFPNSDSLRASHPDLLATSLEEATRSLLLRSPPARSPLPVKRMPDR